MRCDRRSSERLPQHGEDGPHIAEPGSAINHKSGERAARDFDRSPVSHQAPVEEPLRVGVTVRHACGVR